MFIESRQFHAESSQTRSPVFDGLSTALTFHKIHLSASIFLVLKSEAWLEHCDLTLPYHVLMSVFCCGENNAKSTVPAWSPHAGCDKINLQLPKHLIGNCGCVTSEASLRCCCVDLPALLCMQILIFSLLSFHLKALFVYFVKMN